MFTYTIYTTAVYAALFLDNTFLEKYNTVVLASTFSHNLWLNEYEKK
jgi:hypothetical protein